jgi:hypothetical protein
MILFPTLLLFHLLGINGQDSEACLAPTKYLQMKIDPLTEHSGLTVEGVYAYKVGRKTLYKPFFTNPLEAPYQRSSSFPREQQAIFCYTQKREAA